VVTIVFKDLQKLVSHSQQQNKSKDFFTCDEHDNNSNFTIGLQDAGFKVDAYTDAELALSSFKPDYYDLLLLDIKMPKMDGYELNGKLKRISALHACKLCPSIT
jgi:CheY-like chemotaxis protein